MKICYFIICLLFTNCAITYAQHDSTIKINSHYIFLNLLGAQKNSFFSGPSIGLEYQYHIKRKFISLRYQFSEEFLIFGGPAQNATEISVLYNWLFSEKKIFSIGAGVAYTTILADTYMLYGPPSPQTTYGPPYQIRKSTLGLPLNMKIVIPSKRRFTAGLHFNANFNKYTNLFDGGIFMRYRIS